MNLLPPTTVNVDTYLHQFQWDQAKYKLSSPLSDIVDAIVGVQCLNSDGVGFL